MRMSFAAVLRTVALAAALSGLPAAAHEGHDHAPSPTAATASVGPRAEASSDAFELVAVPRAGELTLYLDRFRTNEPVVGATIDVDTPAGSARAAAAEDGTYRIAAPWAAQPGRHDLLLTVTADGTADVLALTLEIPPPPPAPDHAAQTVSWVTTSALAQGLKDKVAAENPALLAAAGGGFLAGALLTLLLMRRRKAAPATAAAVVAALAIAAAPTFAHEGEDHGDAPAAAAAAQPTRDLAQRLADGAVFVPKPTQRILAIRTALTQPGAYRRTVELPGRIIPDPNASGLVQAATGGRLLPPPGGFPRLGTPVTKGDVLAYVEPPLQAIDRSDIRQRQGELDQQISILQSRVDRFTALAQTGTVPRNTLEEARLELQGLKERRVALDRSRREPEPLIAPVSGIVAEAAAVAGQMAQPSAIVFHIVDPRRLWVEALSFDALARAQSATARTGDGRSLTLAYQGSGFADRNQAVPVHFAIEGETEGLRLGQFVTVLAPSEEEKTGLAVPRTSLVRSINGQDIVYEHASAERFEAREVRAEPLDGERVLIAAGLAPGKRVVTQGAELLNQVR